MNKILLSVLFSAMGFGALNAQTYYSEDFESVTGGSLPSSFTSIDDDGDGQEWYTFATGGAQGTCATSASWNNAALTPDNWLIGPAVDLTSATGTVVLEWKVYGQDQSWADENYTVYVATGNTIGDFTGSSVTFNEIVGASNDMWLSRSLDVTSLSGQMVYFAFRHHNVTDMFRINVDDITVRTLPDYEVSLDELNISDRAVAGNVDISGTVSNNGANTITDMDVTWTDGTNSYTDNLTGLSIASGASYTFTHNTQYTAVGGVTDNIEVSVDVANDDDNTNNALSQSVMGLTFQTDNTVLFEEGTGTWCGWCPRGAVAMEYMYDTYGNQGFIGIAVHNGDPMVVTEYDNNAAFTGYPGMNVNRNYLGAGVSQNNMEVYYNGLINRLELAEVDIDNATYDAASGDVTVDVTANFAATLNGDYRFAVVMTEDGVTGTSSDYAQVNYYSGGGNGAMGGYENLPSPVPAADMVYDHVGFELVGGYDGEAGSLPASINADESHSHSFSTTLPSDVNYEEVNVVALLIDNSNGVVINSRMIDLSQFVGIADLTPENAYSTELYPNPAKEEVNIVIGLDDQSEINLNIYNAVGQVVYNNVYTNSPSTPKTIDVSSFEAGVYFVKTTVGNNSSVQKLIIE
mgnify:CR=1 FL=1